MKTLTKLRLARCLHGVVRAAIGVTGGSMERVVVRRGLRWRLDLREGIDLAIWSGGRFEPRVHGAFRRLVGPGSVVFDIGANIGAQTLPLAELVRPGGCVHAFEPTEWAFAKLRANVALNPGLADIVRANNAFLVDDPSAPRPATVPSSWPVDGRAGDDLHPEHGGRAHSIESAESLTLDAYADRVRLTRLDLVKLDVDGHEVTVLRGAKACLGRFRPPILMELASYFTNERGESSFEPLVEIIRVLGYRVFDLSERREIPLDDASFRAATPTGGGVNILLRARS